MTTFLGPVGSLIPVKCASRLTVSGGREVSFSRTLGKQKAFLGQVRARQWDAEIGLAKPSELSGLQWLAESVHSPMVWYPPDAVAGNILTPSQAGFLPGTHSGLEGALVEVEPGVFVKSAFSDVSAVSYPMTPSGSPDPVPIVAGVQTTFSAWMRGATLSNSRQQLSVLWRDINRSVLETVSARFTGSREWQKHSVTLIPPPGAVQFTAQVFASQVAGPAVTLTDSMRPYSPGKGAHKIVVHGLSEAVIRAYEDQQYRSLSFTVSEVS